MKRLTKFIILLTLVSCQNSVSYVAETHRDLLNIKGNVKSTSATALKLSFSEEAMDYVIKDEEKTFYARGLFNRDDLIANGIGCEKYDYVDNVDPLVNLFFDYGNIYKNIVFDNTLFYELNQADNFRLEFNEEGDITRLNVFKNGLRTIDYFFTYEGRSKIHFRKEHNWVDGNTNSIERSTEITGTIEFNDINLVSNFIYALEKDDLFDTISFEYSNSEIKGKKEITCRIFRSDDEKTINLYLNKDNYLSHYVVSGTQYQFENGKPIKISGNNPFIIFEKSSIPGMDTIYINSGNGFSVESVKILRDENNNINRIERNSPSGLEGCTIKYSYDSNGNWIELSYFKPLSELKEIIRRINSDFEQEESLYKIKNFSSYEQLARAEFDLAMKQIEKQYFLNSKKKVIIIREIAYY